MTPAGPFGRGTPARVMLYFLFMCALFHSERKVEA